MSYHKNFKFYDTEGRGNSSRPVLVEMVRSSYNVGNIRRLIYLHWKTPSESKTYICRV